MELTLPSWFKYRQGKAEKIDDQSYRLTAPNLPATVLRVYSENGEHWAAEVRLDTEDEILARGEETFPAPHFAWDAAFELYRQSVVV